MPYDHSKPEIAAAYKAYQDILEKKPKWIKLDDHPDVMAAYANYIDTLEKDGQIYAQTVEIGFPPQLAEQCQFAGIIIPTGRVLKWLANDLESIGEHEQAKLYRDVAMPFYPDPADEEEEDDYIYDDDEDDEEDDGDDFMADLEEAVRMLDLNRASKAGMTEDSSDAQPEK